MREPSSRVRCRSRLSGRRRDPLATVRDGNKPVLLVVDVQNAVMSESWDAPRVIDNVSRAVERARAADVPIIWVQHSDDELAYGTPGWEVVSELEPAEDETRIQKNYNSSFEDTSLD